MYITKTITITVHADYWKLYDLPGRGDAAIALNPRFKQLVNQGATRSEVRNGMRLCDHVNLGAAGHRSPLFIDDLLEIFGDEQWEAKPLARACASTSAQEPANSRLVVSVYEPFTALFEAALGESRYSGKATR